MNPPEATISNVLRAAARRMPDRLALIDHACGATWTYRELDAEVDRVAAGLLLGGRVGDRIAVWSPNRPEVAILAFAIPRARMVMVPLNPALRGGELRYALDNSGSRLVVHARASRGFDMLEHLAVAVEALPNLRTVDLDAGPLPGAPATELDVPDGVDDPAQILYTSGTTGEPKGAILTNRSILHAQRAVIASTELEPGDVIVNVMPMFHVGGLSHGTFLPAILGGTQVLVERYSPAAVLDALAAWECASLLLAPTMVVDLLDEACRTGVELPRLRSVMVGGAPVSVELANRVEVELGVPIVNLFGQTETSGPIAQTRGSDDLRDRTETVGRKEPDVELRIVDPEMGQPVPPGVAGEIEVRGPQTMAGYWERPKATAEIFRPGGWLRTGDIGSLDDRGYLRVHSRLKDMIIRGGENVYPREIEELLEAHPLVQRASVIGLSDPRWGEVVAAIIILAQEQDSADALQSYCRSRLAPVKTPAQWFTVDRFPETRSGKVRKVELRQWVEDGSARPLATSASQSRKQHA